MSISGISMAVASFVSDQLQIHHKHLDIETGGFRIRGLETNSFRDGTVDMPMLAIHTFFQGTPIRGRGIIGRSEEEEEPTCGRDAELQTVSKFALWASVLAYTMLFGLLSANLKRKSNHSTLRMVVHCWSMFMMILVFVGPCILFASRGIRRVAMSLKTMHVIATGFLFASALFGFILLLATM